MMAALDTNPAQIAPEPWEGVPRTPDAGTTYYDRPLLKESVWGIDIPLYYFLGGAAGAALSLGAAIQLVVAPEQHRELRRFSAVCHWTGIVGSTLGAALLVHDLGRPARFVYMLRVFRPTSPMNVGAWILSGAAPTAILTGLFINSRGFLGFVGEASGYLSGVFGAALATYTGVLVSNTAIPVWQASRRWMPFLFSASAAATAGSVIDMFYDGQAGRAVSRLYGTVGRATEIAASMLVERSARKVPRVGEALRTGRPALLWQAASALTAASLALSLFSSKSRKERILVGILGAAGSLCMRFAVHSIGNASARDPRAAFQQQRAAQGGEGR
jgi:hypothetical protein